MKGTKATADWADIEERMDSKCWDSLVKQCNKILSDIEIVSEARHQTINLSLDSIISTLFDKYSRRVGLLGLINQPYIIAVAGEVRAEIEKLESRIGLLWHTSEYWDEELEQEFYQIAVRHIYLLKQLEVLKGAGFEESAE